MGGIAHYHLREWSIQRYTSDCPLTPHPSSHRTLLYALILRAVADYRDTDANIYVPQIHPSKALRHRQNPVKTRHAKLPVAMHPRPCGNQHQLEGLLPTLTAGYLPVVLEIALGGKLLGQSLASGVPPSHTYATRCMQPLSATHPAASRR